MCMNVSFYPLKSTSGVSSGPTVSKGLINFVLISHIRIVLSYTAEVIDCHILYISVWYTIYILDISANAIEILDDIALLVVPIVHSQSERERGVWMFCVFYRLFILQLPNFIRSTYFSLITGRIIMAGRKLL